MEQVKRFSRYKNEIMNIFLICFIVFGISFLYFAYNASIMYEYKGVEISFIDWVSQKFI